MQYPLSAGRTGMPAITTGAVIAVAGVALALLALRTAHAAPELGYAG